MFHFLFCRSIIDHQKNSGANSDNSKGQDPGNGSNNQGLCFGLFVTSLICFFRIENDEKYYSPFFLFCLTEKKKPHIKKPLNAFMLYMKEMRQQVVSECTLKESAAINQILGRRVSHTSSLQKKIIKL